jgi:hypothetical protein
MGGYKTYLETFFNKVFFLKSQFYIADLCFPCFKHTYIYCIMLRLQSVRYLDHRRMLIHKLTNVLSLPFSPLCAVLRAKKITPTGNYRYNYNMIIPLQHDNGFMILAGYLDDIVKITYRNNMITLSW